MSYHQVTKLRQLHALGVNRNLLAIGKRQFKIRVRQSGGTHPRRFLSAQHGKPQLPPLLNVGGTQRGVKYVSKPKPTSNFLGHGLATLGVGLLQAHDIGLYLRQLVCEVLQVFFVVVIRLQRFDWSPTRNIPRGNANSPGRLIRPSIAPDPLRQLSCLSGKMLHMMNSSDIITIPNPRLRERSKRIGHVDAETEALAANMIAATLDWESTREHEFGAALAAVQVSQNYRLIVVRNDFDNKDDKSFNVYVNPEIVKLEGEPTEELEGCLSVKDIYGSVARYPKVKMKALNLEGRPVRVTATGFLARVIQHEVDHTNGTVFVDRVDDPHKLFRLQTSGKFTSLSATEIPAAS